MITICTELGYPNDLLPELVRFEGYRQFGVEVHLGNDNPHHRCICASACTMVLRLDPSKLCATRNAVLGFHAGSTTLTQDVMYYSFPAKVRAWLDERGGLSAIPRYVPATQFVRPCA